MVLAKRSANGEFVAWGPSSQASNDAQTLHQHQNDDSDAHLSKRARLSTPNSSPSQRVSSSAGPAFAASSRNIGNLTPNAHIDATRPALPGVQVISSTSLPHSTPRTTPARQPHATTQAATGLQHPSASSSSSVSYSQHPSTSSGYGRMQDSVSNYNQPSSTSLPLNPTTGVISFAEGSSHPSSSVASAKRGRKSGTDGPGPAEKPEKRQAVFKKKCPQNILDRVERVMTQRIYMIDRTRTGELQEEFSVLGSTGNVYTVVVDHKPRCNCPDAGKGNHCKHILFIMLKVLHVNRSSGYWYQKALLTTELQEIFAGAPLAPNSMAHPHVRDAYARATGKTPAAAPAPTPANDKRRVPGPDDDCPVCYDGMHGVADTSLVFCDDCGNALHAECFAQWQRTAAGAGKALTCVWCRARWVLSGGGGGGGGGVGARRGVDGYLNLAGVGGVSPVRDTSTYYHGPRRGGRYCPY